MLYDFDEIKLKAEKWPISVICVSQSSKMRPEMRRSAGGI